MSIRVVVGGATGWTGSALSKALMSTDDVHLIAGISRTHAGADLGFVLAGTEWHVPIYGDVESALDECDVYVDFTKHHVVKAHVLAALERGVSVVVGASGLTSADYDDIAAAAARHGRGVIAAGNFAVLAALAQVAAVGVAAHVPTWEVIDYASFTKPDVPSGTARELAEKLSEVHTPSIGVAISDIAGPTESRGADVNGTRVHSIRQPGFVVSTEVVFGLPGQRLTIRFDAGESPQPYVDGVLLAIRALPGRVGLTRGIETLLHS